jgi:hypothetical protein
VASRLPALTSAAPPFVLQPSGFLAAGRQSSILTWPPTGRSWLHLMLSRYAHAQAQASSVSRHPMWVHALPNVVFCSVCHLHSGTPRLPCSRPHARHVNRMCLAVWCLSVALQLNVAAGTAVADGLQMPASLLTGPEVVAWRGVLRGKTGSARTPTGQDYGSQSWGGYLPRASHTQAAGHSSRVSTTC